MLEQIIQQEPNFLQWIVLAIVQGLTEYLPVSSSAHLILFTEIMGWKKQGLIMAIAAHAGSLVAVIWYFQKEIIKLFQGENGSLFFKLFLASIPLAVVGYMFSEDINKYLQSPLIIAFASIIFGILLYITDNIQKERNQFQAKQKIGNKHAAIIGIAQVFALIPGASRSGVTMSAAMSMGFNRSTAAKFSFLLAIPALLMTTAHGVLKVYNEPTDYNVLGLVTVLIISFFASLLSIKLFLKLIEKTPIAIFVWYRVILAVLIIWYLV